MAEKEKLVLTNLYKTIEHRRDNPIENSYTCYLLDKGIDKILKKVGEESAEVIIAAKNGEHADTIYEIADLLYHLIVMMVDQGIPLEEVLAEIADRQKKTQNLKPTHKVNKNS